MTEFNLSKKSSLPLHIQLLDELRHKIITGKLQPHDQLPGEWELVNSLNISRATIQKAWQSAQDEGLIYRVAGKGTFVAEHVKHYAEQRSAVAFIIPEYRGTYAMNLLRGAEYVLRKNDYTVQFASTDRDISEENRLLSELADVVAGMILVPVRWPTNDRILGSERLNIPIVLMDRPLTGAALPCVTSNNYAGGLQAVTHLIELGHRNIRFVCRPHMDLWPVAERYRAYVDALNLHGLVPQEPFQIGGDNEMSSYEAYIQQDMDEIEPLITYLKSSDRPTAIFAVNDWIALKVQQAVTLAGLQIPQDISLVGFDNLDIAKYQNPPLTTVAQDSALMGAEAARRLITLMEGDPHQEILTIIPTKLVERNSTRPPQKMDKE